MGVGHAIFETDCLNLKEAMIGRGFDDAPLGVLFRDVRCMLQLNFSSVSVKHCVRVCNKPAHELAALGVREVHGNHAVWLTDLPLSIQRLVAGDLAES